MSERGGKAAKAGLAYTIGNIFLKGITFLTLPLFTRLLTTEQFGVFNLYVSYETLLTIFTGICIYGSLRTAKYDYSDSFSEYTTSVLTLSAVVLFLWLFIGNILYPIFYEKIEFSRLIFNILIIHSYAMFIFQFYNTKVALNFEYKKYLILSGINSIGGTLLSLALILLMSGSDRAYGRILGYAIIPIVIAAFLVFCFFRIGLKEKHKCFDLKAWKYAIKICLPLVAHTFSQQILHQFDRIMIDRMSGKSEVGIYGFMQTVANIFHIIVLSVDNAWSVWMYDQLNEKKYNEIKEKSYMYIILMNIIYVGFVTLCPDVIKILGTEDYHEGRFMIVPLALSIYFIFLYSLPVHIEYYYKKTSFIAIGTSIAAVLNILLNFIFIKLFGFEAAAWTTLASYITLFVFHLFISKKIDNNDMFPMQLIIYSIVGLFVYSSLIYLFIDSFLTRLLLMLFILFIIIYFNRVKIENVIKSFILKRK